MEEFFELLRTFPLPARMAIHLGVALLVAVFVAMVVYPLLAAAGRRADSYTVKTFTNRTRSAVFWALTFAITAGLWESLLPPEETEAVPFLPLAIKIIWTFFYFSLGLFLIRCVAVVADTLRHRYNADDVNNLRERKILTQLQYVQRIAGIVIFIVVAAFILLQFDAMRQLGKGILTTAGISTVIIGFAAQKSIANLLAGFQIAFTQPIRLDDALIVNGEYGWVEEITLTYVVMRLWDQRRQVVPLQKFIDDSFQNWTRTNSELTGTVLIYVDYTFPVQALREEVDRWLPEQDIWDQRVKSVMVTDNSDRAVTIRVLVSAKDAGTTFELRCRTREYLIHWIQEHHRSALPQNRVAPNQNVPSPAVTDAGMEEA